MKCASTSRINNRWLVGLFMLVVAGTILNYVMFPDCGCW
jgi:hypothetical protein